MKGTKHNSAQVSDLMLERYRLGEVTAKERKLVEAGMAGDKALRSRYEALAVSDRELRLMYPREQSPLKDLPSPAEFPDTGRIASRRPMGRFRTGRGSWGIWAAAVLLCVLFPSLYFLRSRTLDGNRAALGSETDRIKGMELKTELAVYLREKTGQAEEGRRLPDRTILREGNTVQLAYTTPPGAVYYGVIFSIDGRSAVTLHYPYRKEQSSLLTAGKRTFLSEAYTLDDAPDFEIFFMVVSQKPLDTEKVLETARELTRNFEREPAQSRENTLAKSAAAFEGCEVETIIVQKQK